MRIKTLKAFSGPDGRYPKGAEVTVRAERGDWLVENGFAERVDKPAKVSAKKAVRKAARKPAKPAPVATPAKPTE